MNPSTDPDPDAAADPDPDAAADPDPATGSPPAAETATRAAPTLAFGRGPEGYRLEAEQWLPLTPKQLFPFFADAFNLEKLTPSMLRFRVVTEPPIEMAEGTIIDYAIRVHGVPMRWRTRIAAWDPPHRFVDTALKSPYRYWHHEHRFEPVDGGTLCRDIIDYRVPLGPLTHWLVKRDLRAIFAYRQQVMANLFGGSA